VVSRLQVGDAAAIVRLTAAAEEGACVTLEAGATTLQTTALHMACKVQVPRLPRRDPRRPARITKRAGPRGAGGFPHRGTGTAPRRRERARAGRGGQHPVAVGCGRAWRGV
jgi:hypothetical protein